MFCVENAQVYPKLVFNRVKAIYRSRQQPLLRPVRGWLQHHQQCKTRGTGTSSPMWLLRGHHA